MLRATILAVFLFMTIDPVAVTQATQVNGAVTIRITDPTGAPIPQARMRVVPYPLALSHKLRTNSEGIVRVALSPGGYEVFAEANGFKPASQKFEVDASTGQMVSVALRVGEGSMVFLTTPRSPDEQQVWDLENTLWKYVANLEPEKYEALWAPNAVALREQGYYLFGQKDVAVWLERYQAGKLELENYSLGEIEVRATGNAAVAYYSVKTLWLDDLGRGTPKWVRVAHTWTKIDGHWRILGEIIY